MVSIFVLVDFNQTPLKRQHRLCGISDFSNSCLYVHTMSTQFRHCKMQCLIRICTVSRYISYYNSGYLGFNWITHFSLETPKRVICKQCRPRSDASPRHIVFTLNIGILKPVPCLSVKFEPSQFHYLLMCLKIAE